IEALSLLCERDKRFIKAIQKGPNLVIHCLAVQRDQRTRAVAREASADVALARQKRTTAHHTLSSIASTREEGPLLLLGVPDHLQRLAWWGVLTIASHTFPMSGVGGTLPETLRCGGLSTLRRPTTRGGFLLVNHGIRCRLGAEWQTIG